MRRDERLGRGGGLGAEGFRLTWSCRVLVGVAGEETGLSVECLREENGFLRMRICWVSVS